MAVVMGSFAWPNPAISGPSAMTSMKPATTPRIVCVRISMGTSNAKVARTHERIATIRVAR